jgi:hypothetical protein
MIGSIACSSSSSGEGPNVAPAGSDAGVTSGSGEFVGGLDGGKREEGEGAVYANTHTELYRFEPRTARLQKVGDFDCVTLVDEHASQQGMADIAINAAGEMFGVGLRAGGFGLMRIDKKTGHCAPVGEAIGEKSLIGLSFVPAGTVDRTSDALVTTSLDGTYFRLDPTTGKATALGGLGNAELTKSGDVVSIKGAGTFVTVGERAQHLYRIDTATGQIQADIGNLGSDLLGGLAYWGGTLYGFTFSGTVLAIDPATAQTTAVTTSASHLEFWGAGVETTAPVTPLK